MRSPSRRSTLIGGLGLAVTLLSAGLHAQTAASSDGVWEFVSDNSLGPVGAGSGPFAVTAPNTGSFPSFGEGGEGAMPSTLTLPGGSPQTVTWNVAGTNAAPVNATNVSILLSTDSGQTFPTTLLASTPNNGSQAVVIPNNATTTTRIKVKGVGNVFYDISNVAFTVTLSSVTFTDDPLVVGTTLVKAVHFQEMRDRINTLRTGRGLSAFSFTDATLVAGTTQPRAIHLTELRTALSGVYTNDGLALPSYTNTSITAGSVIRAVDVTELRAAIVARE